MPEIDYSKKYLAYVLDAETALRLTGDFPPKFGKKVCHHITIEYDNVTKELYDRFLKKKMDCYAIQHLSNNGVECFVATIDGLPVRPDSGIYHITHSLERGHSAVESNLLIQASKIQDQFKIPLYGSLKLLSK